MKQNYRKQYVTPNVPNLDIYLKIIAKLIKKVSKAGSSLPRNELLTRLDDTCWALQRY